MARSLLEALVGSPAGYAEFAARSEKVVLLCVGRVRTERIVQRGTFLTWQFLSM